MHPRGIAFIGTCSLVGYPLGQERAFPTLVAEAAGNTDRVTLHILQPVAAHHLARAAAFVDATSPDVVVLQLGNFETSLSIASLIRRQFGRPGLRSEGGYRTEGIGAYTSNPDLTYQPTSARRLRVAAKGALHRLWLHRLVHVHETATNIRDMAVSLQDASGLPVLVLDPIPCADPGVAGYRARLRDLLGLEGGSIHHVPLDPALFHAEGESAFADAIHLGPRGHQLVAQAVLTAVAELPPVATG